jgi:hypothetical protein
MVIVSFSVLGLGGYLAPGASAGTNGQMVYLDLRGNHSCGNGTGLTDVTIQGQNQNGAPVTWRGRSANGATLLLGNGWWWKNKVTISYSQAGRAIRTTAWIPPWNDAAYQQRGLDNQVLNPDVVEVDCHGSRWYGTRGPWVTGEGSSLACVSLGGNLAGHYLRRQRFTGYWGDTGVNGVHGQAAIGGRFGWEQPFVLTGGLTSFDCG